MEPKMVASAWRTIQGTGKRFCYQPLRMMTLRAANRAAVHGTRLPIPDVVDKEEVKKEINKGKEEKEKKRKEVEEKVDSQLKGSQVLADSDTG